METAATMNAPLLTIDGLVEIPLSIGFEEIAAIPADAHVADVSAHAAGRAGEAVTLESLLALARPLADANYVTLHAGRDDFHVSIPLEAVRSEAFLIFRLDGAPLDVKKGGPFRLVIKDAAACRTAELDDCANVKFLDRIELTHRKGRDTRPTTADEHAALHAKEQH
jgi:DMSO/TMAO reductase YedYZ molybdopterin-dependent catalytic subunit